MGVMLAMMKGGKSRLSASTSNVCRKTRLVTILEYLDSFSLLKLEYKKFSSR